MAGRREFIKTTIKAAIGLVMTSAFGISWKTFGKDSTKQKRWVFLVDTKKCIGCGFCVKACKTENEVPYDVQVSRTWVERYLIKKDGRIFGDTPKAARDGFTDSRIDLGHGNYEPVKDEEIAKAFFVPKLCNHCENPPCVQACPVGATYQRPDGVVLVDRTHCMGCAYCIMSCPFGSRFIHPVIGVAEKCTFCIHRVTKGMEPACVAACPQGARKLGDRNDLDDPVTNVIIHERVNILKDEFGTKPQTYYLHLSMEVR